jgi:hypothetical protein
MRASAARSDKRWIRVRLLATEGDQRVEAGGVAGGDPRGGNGHGADDEASGDEGDGVHGADLEQF